MDHCPLHLGIGVFQGDPLSVSIFNTVMNTLVDTLLEHRSLGYHLSQSSHICNHLQYMDDTCLIGDGPASCQALLTNTEQWLEWARMKAKVPKSASLAFQASTGRGYDPSLRLQGDTIPFIGNSTFRFLGAPITIHDAKADHRDTLLSKLESMLKKVDDTLLTRQQKLHLYSHGICPRLVWDIVISNLSITWVVKNLEATATRFLKHWSGLARSVLPIDCTSQRPLVVSTCHPLVALQKDQVWSGCLPDVLPGLHCAPHCQQADCS